MRMRYHFHINKQDKSKGHSSSQTAVHHNELVHSAELVQTVTVGDTAKNKYADTSKEEIGSKSRNLLDFIIQFIVLSLKVPVKDWTHPHLKKWREVIFFS